MEKIEELIQKYTNIFNQSKPDFLDDPFSRGEDAGAGIVSHEIIEDLKQLKSSLPKPVEVPEFVAELYYIKLPKLGLNFMQPDGYIWRDKYGMLHSLHAVTDMKFMFTEQEIKAIDERYWAFAVPVEEEVE